MRTRRNGGLSTLSPCLPPWLRARLLRLWLPILWLWISAIRLLRLRLSTLWLWLETRLQHLYRTGLGLGLLSAESIADARCIS
jgi:hypothetical protein